MEEEVWFSEIVALPSLFSSSMSEQMVNEKQCFALCTLAEYVAHYATHWWNKWFREELKSSSAARVGMELVKGLRKGLQLLQFSAAKDSTVVWTIVRGAGPFREVIEDVRRYAQMMNRLIKNCSDSEKREIVEQLRHKVEFDCRVLQTSLEHACRLDRITILEGFKSRQPLNNKTLLLDDVLLSCLISILEKRLPSEIAIENLPVKGLLGQGSYGCVMTTKLSELPVAVKNFLHKDYFEDELKIYKEFLKTDYPCHVVGILGCSDSCRIVLELMDKNLKEFIEEKGGPSLPYSESVDIMLQIAEGMRFLHGSNVIYRDLKPANVLIQVREGEGVVVRLADFGVSKEHFRTELTNTSCQGTMLYMAPEMMMMEEDLTCKYTRKVDVYSFGMVCSEILTGKQRVLKPIELKAGERPPLPENIPISLGRLIQRCWHQDPHNRPQFEQICDELWLIKEKCLTEDVEAALDDKTKLSFTIGGLRRLRVESAPDPDIDHDKSDASSARPLQEKNLTGNSSTPTSALNATKNKSSTSSHQSADQTDMSMSNYPIGSIERLRGTDLLVFELKQIFGNKWLKCFSFQYLVKQLAESLQKEQWLVYHAVWEAKLDLYLLDMMERKKIDELLLYIADGHMLNNAVLEFELNQKWFSLEEQKALWERFQSDFNQSFELAIQVSGTNIRSFLQELKDQIGKKTKSVELANLVDRVNPELYEGYHEQLDYYQVAKELSTLLKKCFQEQKLDVTTEVSKDMEEWLQPNLMEMLKERMRQCEIEDLRPVCGVSCPQCGKSCRLRAGHRGKHDTVHQPQGLKGIIWGVQQDSSIARFLDKLLPLRVLELVETSCAKGIEILKEILKPLPFALDLEGWETPREGKGCSSQLREYVFFHYQDHLVKRYPGSKKCRRIPREYRHDIKVIEMSLRNSETTSV